MTTEGDDNGRSGALATIASGAGLVFGGRIIRLSFGFLSQIIMAQLLGTSSYGSVVLVTISLRVATLFSTMGLRGGLSRNVPYFEDAPEKARGVVKAAGQIGAVSSGVLAGMLFVGAPQLATVVFQDPDIGLLLRIGALSLPFLVLRNVSIATAKGARDAKTHVAVKHVLKPPLHTILVTVFILRGYGAPGAVTAMVLTHAVTAFVAAYLAIRTLPFSLRGPTTRMHRQLLSFSIPLMFSAGMNLLVFEVDTVLVGALLESASAGVYNVVFEFRSIGMFFFFSLAFLLPPVLTRLDKQGEYEEALRTYQITSKWMAIATLPILVGFVLFPEIIIETFFGEEYTVGSSALRILMLPILVTVLLGPNGRALVALGHNRVNMYVNGGIGGVNLLLNLLLIPRYGILGAATATATALVARDIAFALVLYRREKIYAISLPMVRTVVGATVLAAGGYVLADRLVEFSIVSGVVWGIAFVLLYLPTIVLLGGIEAEDTEMVRLFEQRTGIDLAPVRRTVVRLQR